MKSIFASKTMWFNAAAAALAVILPQLASVDWTLYVSPSTAIVVVGGINMALRYVTTTMVTI